MSERNSDKLQVFLDSDVIVSSRLSTKGAAYALIRHVIDIKRYISTYSLIELEEVFIRNDISLPVIALEIKERITIIEIQESLDNIKDLLREYVFDSNDAHILHGTIKSQASFLITYNIKDYNTLKIKNDFNIVVLTPGHFLQYLRSIGYY